MSLKTIIYCVAMVILFILIDTEATTATKTTNHNATTTPTTSTTTTTTKARGGDYSPMDIKHISTRAIIVVAAISGLVILYFIIRAICSNRRRSRNRRYGMLKDHGSEANMEMRPLSEGDDDDDDDDMTLFDASQRRNKR